MSSRSAPAESTMPGSKVTRPVDFFLGLEGSWKGWDLRSSAIFSAVYSPDDVPYAGPCAPAC